MNYSEKINKAIDIIVDGDEEGGKKALQSVVSFLKKEVKKKPTVAHLKAWALCYEVMEEYEQAILRYEKVLMIENDNEEALWRIASLCVDCLNKPEPAVAILKNRLLKINPESEIYKTSLAELERLVVTRSEREQKKGEDSTTESSTPPPIVH